ncbi:MAG: hypothetical protein HY815_12985 [Candidatus Riflebacteria bacterium]|nr:hypothetical protein [Candidatus Riflebacteria bacterium]
MGEKLTWDEIKKRFPDEWVVLVDSSFNENEDLTEGTVFAHGSNRDTIYDQCRRAPSPFAVRFTGQLRGGLIGFYAEDLEEKSQPRRPTR